MKKPVIAILSGGMDSTVLAYDLALSNDYQLTGAVSINYGQKHKFELLCAGATCKRLNIPHYVVDLSAIKPHIGTSALTGAGEVPKGHYAEDSMKATVVPNRNMMLISMAVAIAISKGAQAVAYGAHAGDHAIYPDCRPEFAQALDATISLCDYNPPVLLRPFIDKTKAQIVSRGLVLSVPFENTWTCYEGVPNVHIPAIACGTCGTCVERLEAFEMATGSSDSDPLQYKDRTSWRKLIRDFNKKEGK